jgi:hypothetical protein
MGDLSAIAQVLLAKQKEAQENNQWSRLGDRIDSANTTNPYMSSGLAGGLGFLQGLTGGLARNYGQSTAKAKADEQAQILLQAMQSEDKFKGLSEAEGLPAEVRQMALIAGLEDEMKQKEVQGERDFMTARDTTQFENEKTMAETKFGYQKAMSDKEYGQRIAQLKYQDSLANNPERARQALLKDQADFGQAVVMQRLKDQGALERSSLGEKVAAREAGEYGDPLFFQIPPGKMTDAARKRAELAQQENMVTIRALQALQRVEDISKTTNLPVGASYYDKFMRNVGNPLAASVFNSEDAKNQMDGMQAIGQAQAISMREDAASFKGAMSDREFAVLLNMSLNENFSEEQFKQVLQATKKLFKAKQKYSQFLVEGNAYQNPAGIYSQYISDFRDANGFTENEDITDKINIKDIKEYARTGSIPVVRSKQSISSSAQNYDFGKLSNEDIARRIAQLENGGN